MRHVTRLHRGPVNDITVLLPEGPITSAVICRAAWALPLGLLTPWSSGREWLSGWFSPAVTGPAVGIYHLPQIPASAGVCSRPLGRKARSLASCMAVVWGVSYRASKLLPLLLFLQDYFYPRYLGKLSPCLYGRRKGIEGDSRLRRLPELTYRTCVCLSRPRVRVSLRPAPLLANGFSARTPGFTSCLGLGLT